MLERNSNHKKIDVSNIKSSGKKISTILFGGLISISLLSGCVISTYTYINDYNIGDYSVTDLNRLESLKLIASEGTDFTFLNNCNNLEHLFIVLDRESVKIKDSQLDESTFNNLRSLYLKADGASIEYEAFNEDNFGVFRDCPNLKDLKLSGVSINPSFLEGFHQVERLTIENCMYESISYNYFVDYSKMNNLRELRFKNVKLYDLCVCLNNDLINMLLDKGVKIDCGGVKLSEVIEENKKLEEIVNSLNVDKNSDDFSKLNAILNYIVENYEYDVENVGKFDHYEDGGLDAAMKSNKIICGNYAALFQALSSRLGMESYSVYSHTHAWNLVNVNGVNYYTDVTFLDGSGTEIPVNNKVISISKNEFMSNIYSQRKLRSVDWYLEPTYREFDESHTAKYIPSNKDEYLEPNSIVAETTDEIYYDVKVGDAVYVLGTSTLLGILCMLGYAFKASYNIIKDKNSNRRKK